MISRLIALTTERVICYGPKVGSNWITIHCKGSELYLGGTDLTDVNGLPVPNGETISLFIERGEILYAIGKTGGELLHILEPSSA